MPSWTPACLGIQSNEGTSIYPNRMTTGDDLNSNRSIDDNCNPELRYGFAVVELMKKDSASLGLIISGGEDKGSKARISNLRPGGLAYRSDALCVDDHIVSVNGIRTAKLKHDEIINLLKNADGLVTLEVEYELPYSPSESLPCVCPKAIQVRLEKENGSFGFVLRGGVAFGFPLTVTFVRPGGPSDREGTIKAGDRLLAVDNISLLSVTQCEAVTILKQIKYEGVFTVEYDVSLMEAVRNASGPLLVEIERGSGGNQQFGVALSTSYKEQTSILIHSIKQASLAERCGALHVGDRVLAIDGVSLEGTTAAEASQLLKNSCGDRIRLEILPLSQMLYGKRLPEVSVRKGMSTSSFATLGSFYRNLGPYSRANEWRPQRSMEPSPSSSSLPSCVSSCSASALLPPPLCRPETTDVILCASEQRSFGFALRSGPSASPGALPIIGSIDPEGPAERSGVIQVGDRILSVNGLSMEGRSVEDVSQMLLLSKPRVNIRIEFDVAESVVPSSGVFDVRLPCKGTGSLGVTLTGTRDHHVGEVPTISDVRRGGVAHRTGTIHIGDQLLAIGTIETDKYSLEEAVRFLKDCHDEVVRLRICKNDQSAIAVTTRIAEKNGRFRGFISHGVDVDAGSECDNQHLEEEMDNNWIVYSVEMIRRGCGPLGITVAGSEEPYRPIVISGLVSGGLAQQTGALHVGDRLLAVNGTSLRDKSLGSVIQLLQNSGDVVTMKVARIVGEVCEGSFNQEESPIKDGGGGGGGGTTPLPSIDSAVESWNESIAAFDGLHLSSGNSDHHGGLTVMLRNHHQQPKRDSSRRSPTYLDNDLEASRGVEEEDEQDNDENDEGRPELVRSINSWQTQCQTRDSMVADNQNEEWTQMSTEFKCKSEQEVVDDELACQRTDDMQIPSATDASDLMVLGTDIGEHHNLHRRVSDEALYPRQRFADDKVHASPLQKTESGCGNGLRLHVNTLPHGARNSRRRGNREVDSLDGPGSQCGVDDNTDSTPYPIEVHRVTLFKDSFYEDFGFSVSDGLYERGVYVNRIRPGGPAEIGGILRAFDRILQVNDTKTHDFDCCLTVPLIAAAGDRIRIVVVRNPYCTGMSIHRSQFGIPLPWLEEERQPHDRIITTTDSSMRGDSITKSL